MYEVMIDVIAEIDKRDDLAPGELPGLFTGLERLFLRLAKPTVIE
jgi:hypothetical protein